MLGENPKIIYNVTAGLGATVGAGNFERFGTALTKANFEGISTTPLKAQTFLKNIWGSFPPEQFVARLKEYYPQLVMAEESWNPPESDNLLIAGLDGLHGSIRRLGGDMSEPPTVVDAGFFPGRQTSREIVRQLMVKNKDAFYGAISLGRLEQYPGRSHRHLQSQFMPHSVSLESVVDETWERGAKLLYDPTHLAASRISISLPRQPTWASRNEQLRQLEYIGKRGRLKMVDLHAGSQKEIDDFRKGTGFLFDLAVLSAHFGADFTRVEIPLPNSLQYLLRRLDEAAVADYFGEIVEIVGRANQKVRS